MKLYVRGRYHNGPANLHFDHPGVVEIDEDKAQFLLHDAPENFSRELPADPKAKKAMDRPAADRAVKAPAEKKAASDD